MTKFQPLKKSLGFGLMAGLCFMSGCGLNLGPTGGHRGQFIVTLTSMSPSTVTAGGPPFVLTVNGSNLTACYSTLVWNGGQHISSVPPISCNNAEASFVIDATLIADPGSVSIAVVDGIDSNQVSNALTLTVEPHTTTACALFGLYHYMVTGFDSQGPIVAAGAFAVDASGNVIGEYGFGDEYDPFSFFGNTPDNPAAGAGGHCTNGSAPNQGTVTLTTPCYGTSLTSAFTYSFVLEQGGGGRLVESNDNTGCSGYGDLSSSGTFAKVTPNAVFNGNYVFGMAGGDFQGDARKWTRSGAVGQFAFSNGSLNGVVDLNDGGTLVSNATISEAGLSPQFSMDVYAISSNINLSLGGPLGWVNFLMTSPTTGFVVGTIHSPVASTGGFLTLVGYVSSQASPGAYGNSSLNAPLVLSASGAPPPVCCTTSTDTTLGLASGFNSGAGTFNLLLDNVSGGVANLNQTVTGATYSVASNGRATVSYSVGGNTSNYIYYLDNSNDGFILGLGNGAEFGSFHPQSSGPFSAASINGTFASATFLPLLPSSPNLAAEITLNNGSLSANMPSGTLTGTYSVAASGRGSASVNLPVLGGKDLVFYVVGPDSIVVMGSDNTAADAITSMHL